MFSTLFISLFILNEHEVTLNSNPNPYLIEVHVVSRHNLIKQYWTVFHQIRHHSNTNCKPDRTQVNQMFLITACQYPHNLWICHCHPPSLTQRDCLSVFLVQFLHKISCWNQNNTELKSVIQMILDSHGWGISVAYWIQGKGSES